MIVLFGFFFFIQQTEGVIQFSLFVYFSDQKHFFDKAANSAIENQFYMI